MYVLYMCCQGVVYAKLAGSMYDIHANEDICDFKRGVCHKPVILTNIFAVVFWRIIFPFWKPFLESKCPSCMASVEQDKSVQRVFGWTAR